MASWEKFSRIVAEAKAAKKLDPVGHEDDDVDNDGDSDSSDSYLKKRRATVGAAIAADKKKKVEEAKQLDPVGKEDDDIDNDGDHDKSDKYLLNRRKVRSKIIQREEVEQIDEFNLNKAIDAAAAKVGPVIDRGVNAVFGKPKVTIREPKVTPSPTPGYPNKAVPEPASNKFLRPAPSSTPTSSSSTQSQQKNYGNVGSLGNVGGNLRYVVDRAKERNKIYNQQNSYQPEGEQIDEFFFGPSKVTPKGGQLSGSKAPVEVDKKYTAQKQGQLVNVQYDKGGNRKVTPMSNMERGVAALKLRQSGGGASSLSMDQYQKNSYEPEGELVDEGKSDKKLPEHKRSAARLARYDNPSGALALGGGQQRARRAEHEERRGVKKEELEIEEGMTMKDFKANRKKNERKEASADARKRGHEGSEWHNTGRTYSADEAKSRREKMTDTERSARHASAVDPDNEDHSNYSADKTKDPKKLRKQKAMGEGYLAEKSLSRAQQRFMGMVYAAKKGETPASAEVAKAAEGMSKKAAKDFAKTKHEGLPEKKVSEAVEPGGGGRAPTLPASEKFIDELPQKLGQLFNKFNAGKKTKQPPVKEELSLVERILDEAIKGTIAGGTSRAKKYKVQAKDVRIKQIGSAALSGDKKQVKRLKKANENPTRKITERGEVEGKKSEEERKDAAKKNAKRGKSDPSALARRATIAGASRIKAEKEKTKRQRERLQYEKERRAEKKAEREERAKEKQEKLESSYKEKRIKAAQQQSDKEESRKERTKDEMKGAVVGALKRIKAPQVVSDKAKGSTGGTVDSYIDSAGSVVSAVGKGVRGVIAAKMKERKEKKQDQKRQERHEKIRSEMSKEEFSNWREEFILEVDDQSVQNEKQKVIDVSKKKNKIEINPNMSEGCGCDEKETPKKDMRDLPTKVNLAKTKLRSAGVRNPVVMVTSEENIQEIAPLVGVLARVAGGAAARGITSRVAGSAAQGTLRSKTAELLGKKAGQMTAQAVQDKLTPKFKDEPEIGSEPYMTNLEKRLRNEDWQSVNRKDKTDGLSQKAVNAYRRENPGSKLQTAVTEKKPTGKRAARRKSFCSRMKGMKDRLTSAETARDPDSRINKALRRWNCN